MIPDASGLSVCSLICYSVLCVQLVLQLSCGEERAGRLLYLPSCLVTVSVLWLFLVVRCIGLRYVIVVFPDHTNLFMRICMD